MTASGPARILFVDDEPNVLEALRRMLRQRSQAWEMVFHTLPSVALADQRRQAFDVAVVDMKMPEMNGLELASALQSVSAATRTIMLTGAADLQTAMTAINETGIFRFYTKPCDPDVLAAGIEQALAADTGRAMPATTEAPQASSAALGLAMLDRLPSGVAVVDAQNRVLYMNSLGATVISANDGLSIDPAGICRASRPAETRDLHRLIRQAIDEPAGQAHAISLTRTRAERPLSVVVAPLAAGSAGEKAAVLLVSDPERVILPSLETVMRLFELTEAEGRLALSMSQGHRIEDAAQQQGITVSSARTYLKRVFAKTGVDRQAELVRLIVAAPSLLDRK